MVLDYYLGHVEGPVLLRELRAVGLPETVPALLLTSHGSEESAVAALRAGAADYLPKSEGLRGAALERAVLKMVEQARLRVDRDRAVVALQRRTEQAEQLAQVLAAVGASPGLVAALAALSAGALTLLRGETCSVHAVDATAGVRLLSLEARPGETPRRTAGQRPLSEGSVGWRVARTGEAILVEDYQALDPQAYPAHERVVQMGKRASVNVPINAAGRVVGTLHVTHPQPGFFGPEDLALAAALATMAGAATERARLETARIEAEAAHHESEARYRAVVEQSVDGVAIAVGPTYVLMNPAAARIFGVADPAELVGKPITTYVHPDEHARLRDQAERRQRGEAVPSTYECRIVRPSGEERTVEISATSLLYSGQPASLAIVRDVTDRKRAEAEVLEVNQRLRRALEDLEAAQEHIVQQERLRALGEMAAGIAHDLNNALSPVAGFSELLLVHPASVSDSATLQRYLGLIHTGAQDAAGVVRRLREFYRPRENADVLAPVDLARVAEQVIALTEPKWKDQAQAHGRTIHVKTDLAPVPPASGVEAELRELLTNLIFNAVDALPLGGAVTVRTWPSEDGRAVLEVADTGTGMDEETRRRCLEPFFTTKGEKGTGLGLSMVHGTVRRHGGELDIDSTPGQGTTIRITLPAWGTRTPDAPAHQTPAAAGRPLSVLIVDDEPAVRQVTAAFVTHDGHHVTCAADGYEALRLLPAGPVDLLITDRAMPGMSGDQLAQAVKDASPATAVVLLTGFGDLMDATGERPRAIDAVLAKPVKLATLRAAVARVTAASPT